MSQSGWIGVDLDGTLAMYHGFHGPTYIGDPIPDMVKRIHRWRVQGRDVRIFTARAYAEPGDAARAAEVALAIKTIEEWCLKNLGFILPITCTKDYGMVELWDDRAVQVIPNTGLRVDGNL